MKRSGLFVLLLLNAPLFGQGNLNLTIEQVDSMFLRNNLMLLAQQYNIQAQEALVIQARAYPNPIFSVDLNAIDPQNNELFHVGQTGEKAFTLEQLILLGGKRKAEIDIARQHSKIAILELEDMLRNLRLQVHQSFFQIYQQLRVLGKFNRQLQLLDTLISSYEVQARRGNLPLKDVVRLKSVYIKINNDKLSLATENFEEEKQIQILIQSQANVVPLVSDDVIEGFNHLLALEDLETLGKENRPDLKMASEENSLSLLTLRLQRKQAIPDVVLNASYDQRGGAFVNQANVGISIPLPLWNLNKGNIKAASYNAQSIQLYQQQVRMQVEAEVRAAWNKMDLIIGEFNRIKNYYNEDFDEVFRGVNANFQKRNISILEFVDFFESYNESLSEYERVKNRLAASAIEVNYATASKVY